MSKSKIQNETQISEKQINEEVTIIEPSEKPVLNADQIAQFSPYESYFKNIYYYGTIGATDHAVETALQQVFTNVTGRALQSWTCSTCRKANWYKLARLYFDSINHINSVKKEEVCSEQDIID